MSRKIPETLEKRAMTEYALVADIGGTNIRTAVEAACNELKVNGRALKGGAILLTDGEHDADAYGPFGNPHQCFIDNE